MSEESDLAEAEQVNGDVRCLAYACLPKLGP